MTKDEFKKEMRKFFSDKGFFCKGTTHYYKEVSNDVVIVFGLNMTYCGRGKYCYMEHGYCFKSTNKHLPYPRFDYLDLILGRIMTSKGQSIVYEELDEDVMNSLKKAIDAEVDEMTHLVDLGREEMIKHYLNQSDLSWWIMGQDVADYFGLPREAFKYHFINA